MSAIPIHTLVEGPANRPVVVLSNSLGTTFRMWDSQIDKLQHRFRVVRYDMRGHGASAVPSGPYSIDDLADDLVAVLDAFDFQRVHLVGLSLGGMVALRVAARNPERVNRLAVLCTAALLPPPSAWIQRAAAVRAHGSGTVAAAVAARWFTKGYLAAHPAAKVAAEAMVAATPVEGYAGCCEAIAAVDLRSDLASITAPTLAIAGADDPATPPACLAEIATGMPDARLLVVPHAAHLANVERPEAITHALIEHLEQA